MADRLRISTLLFFAAALAAFAVPGPAVADVLGFATDNNGDLYSVNLTNATATLVGGTGIADFVEGLALDTNGTLYGTDSNGSLYTLDTTTGAATLIGDTGLGNIEGLAFNGGTLVAANFPYDTTLYELNTNTAAATMIAATAPAVTAVRAMTITGPTSGFLLGDLQSGQGLFSVDPASGATALLGVINPIGSLAAALAAAPGGELYALDMSGNAYSVAADGNFTLIGNTGNHFYLDLAIYASTPVVPEPSSLVLCGIGAAVVLASTRRARSRR
jgi:hypothetical protein